MCHLRRWLWLGSLCLTGSSLGAGLIPPGGSARSTLQGGGVDQAVVSVERNPAFDSGDPRAHLTVAAALLEKGDERGACPHLAIYVRAHPDHFRIRVHYAELLFRLQRQAEAKNEFEQVVALAQDEEISPTEQLLECHTRLMEMNEAEGDEYGEHLHRGIGVYYLARLRVDLPDLQGKLSAESLLCQAAGELALARIERPEEARPCWYLYEVWTLLGQRRPALHCLQAAGAASALSTLTPAERRGLHLALLMDNREPRPRH